MFVVVVVVVGQDSCLVGGSLVFEIDAGGEPLGLRMPLASSFVDGVVVVEGSNLD